MVENKRIEKRFVKEALGTRNYFSYRMDLMLYKIILSVLVGTAIYVHTSDSLISVIIGIEVFAIFTLVNKLHIKRKKNEGEEKLINKMKMEHFKKKIDEINQDDFEMLIGFLFEKSGFRNFIKKGRHMFLTERDGLINCIKIYKLYDNMELEKIDVRNLVSFMCECNIRIGYIIITGKLSGEAKKFLESFENSLDIHIVDMDELFSLMDGNGILPNNDFFYDRVCEEKVFEKKKETLKNNIFDSKKVLVYILASVFFYITSIFMPENVINRYISYYFILLTAISTGCIVWNKYVSDRIKN